MKAKRLSQLSGTTSDKVRLMVMGGLLIVVAGLYLLGRSNPSAGDSAAPDDHFRPDNIEENAPPAAKVDFARLTDVRDSTDSERVTREADPFQHLIEECARTVPGDFRRLGARNIDPELYAAMSADPGAYRGQPFTAKGLFGWSTQIKIPFRVAGLEAEKIVYQGVFQDELGHVFSYSALDPPVAIEEGQVVRFDGFFFKKMGLFHPTPGPDGTPELTDNTLHLVGKRLVRSFLRMEPVTKLSPALLGTVRDYEISEQMEIPEEVLYHGLSFLQNIDADTLARHAQDTTAAALRINPEMYRGQPVRVLGTFYETFPRQLGDAGENPLEIPTVYHGILVHSGPTFTYFISLEREPEWIEDSTNVIVEGLFLKKYLYQSKGGQPVSCPLILAKRFVPFEVDTSAVNNTVFFGLLGLAAVLVIWFGFTMYGDRNANQEFRKRYYERKKKQLQATLASKGSSDS